MGVWPRLIALTDDRVIAGGRVVERAAAMAGAAGSALCVGLRSRALGDGDLHALAVRLAGVLAPHGSLLAVSGRADIARSVGAAIVLAGRGAMATADLKRVSPQAAVIRSVHDRAEIEAARADGADAVMAGPVFETASHPGAPAAGVSLVTAALAAAPKAFAVGGITSERVAEVLAAGAWGVAAIRALWDSDDPAAAAGAFLEALPADDSIALTINGEPRRARRGLTLANLLGELRLDPRAVVVERNRQIVRREALAGTPVAEGDSLELVHFVGGG